MHICKRLTLCVFSLLCLLSCGLEVVYYIDYITPSTPTDVESISRLPSSSSEGYSNYFTDFMIFYRIYTSGQLLSQAILESDSAARSSINATLNSDFNSLAQYTDYTSTIISTSNLENIFINNRNYYRLALEGANITSVLSRDALGKELVISFPPNDMPTLALREAGNVTGSYTLQRASSTDLPQPLPNNRYFLNHQDLYNSANAARNPDVAANSSTNPPIRYTYICLYIAARGWGDDLIRIYSQPTYLGVFRLPESSNVL